MTTNPRHLGKYELRERLAQGGMAEVWKAFDPQLKRYVAIKFLQANLRSDPDFMIRFTREAQAIASLHHPNIVQVYDFQTSQSEADSSMAYMIMDYVEGQTLASFIYATSRIRRFPTASEIVHLFIPIGLAIDYAHQHGIIHRDIKPANILLDARNTNHNPMGEPILTDFGIVKMLGTATLTNTGTSMGTPLYISPEQVQGQPGSEKSDIYSLGVTLYEICTGIPPFRGDTPYAIMVQHVTKAPPPPSTINSALPTALDSVILRCLAKEPESRFASASSMVVALAEALKVPVPEQVNRFVSSQRLEKWPVEAAPANAALSLKEAHPASTSAADMETMLSASNTPSADMETMRSAANTPPTAHVPAPEMSREIRGAVPTAGSSASHERKDTPLPPSSLQSPPAVSSAPSAPTAVPTPPRSPDQRRRGLLAVIGAVVVILLGASLGTFFLARSTGNRGSTNIGGPTIVGHAAFFSSRQLNGQGTPGINDGLEVQLQNIPNPSPGNRYYAWLRDNQTETASINLGTLNVNQGTATLSYVDSQHRDLLSMVSNFLVTEESASVVPDNPTLDKTKWRYSGALPQIPSPRDNFSYLDHVRHLLSKEPALDHLHLFGGVDFWFLTNIEEMQKQVMEVKDHTDLQVVRQHLANILYYLDGPCAAQDLSNAPGPKSPENASIAHDTQVGLLTCAQVVDPPGHVSHIGRHLNGIAQAPGATQDQIKRATQINANLNNIKAWLEQVLTDAKLLATMSDDQLLHSQNVRVDMATQADYAISGRIDPATQVTQPSAGQITNEIELLANFDVMPYHA